MPNIYQVARYHSLRRPDALALADRERRIDFATFHRLIRRVAGRVAAEGAGSGSRVLSILENSIEYVALYHATAIGRFVLVPVNVRFGPQELLRQAEDCEPSLILFDAVNAELAGSLKEWARARGIPMLNVATSGWGDAELACDHLTDRFGAVEEDDTALILYTSGTTSRPKGAMLTHGNLAWNCINYILEAELNSRSRAIMTTPLFHIAGFGVLNGPVLYAGGAIYVMPRFDAVELHGVLRDFVPTNLSLLSPMWVDFTNRFSPDDGTFPEVATVQTAAAPLSEARQEMVQRLFPNAEWIWGFGMTETCVTTIRSRTTEDVRRNPGTIGQPWRHVKFRLVDEAEETIATSDTVGELRIKGPTVFKGYWRDTGSGGSTLDAEGWLRTGDLLRLDAEEYAFFVGRSKDMIKTGGENVASLEVETALIQHPEIIDAAAFGLPHDRWGEELVAAVVRHPDSALAPEALIAWARGRLTAFKTPKRVFLVDSLPRSSSGKIQKFRLQESFR